MSRLNFTIQKATWRDFSQLNELDRQCFSKQDRWPFWDIIGILSFPGYVRLKAVYQDQMIGFIGGERISPGSVGWVTTLSTAPAYQRLGVATMLLDACEKELGTPTIRLTVRLSNETAIQLYEKAGYIMVDRRKGYYVGGEDALVYEKRR